LRISRLSSLSTANRGVVSYRPVVFLFFLLGGGAGSKDPQFFQKKFALASIMKKEKGSSDGKVTINTVFIITVRVEQRISTLSW